MKNSSHSKQYPARAAAGGATFSLPRLSSSASEFVTRHPERAALAVSAALEAAAAQFESLEDIAPPEIPEPLRRFVTTEAPPNSPGELISVEEAAKRLQVTRATVYA